MTDAKFWNSRSQRSIIHIALKMHIALALRDAMAERNIKSVLDIGCGAGINFPIFASLGCAVLGVDYAGERIEIARAVVGELGYDRMTTVEQLDAVTETLPGGFDAAVLSFVLQHLPPDQVAALIEKVKAAADYVFLIEYYTETFHLLLDRHEALCEAHDLDYNEIDAEQGFISRLHDYPALFGVPYKYRPLGRNTSLLIFGTRRR